MLTQQTHKHTRQSRAHTMELGYCWCGGFIVHLLVCTNFHLYFLFYLFVCAIIPAMRM